MERKRQHCISESRVKISILHPSCTADKEITLPSGWQGREVIFAELNCGFVSGISYCIEIIRFREKRQNISKAGIAAGKIPPFRTLLDRGIIEPVRAITAAFSIELRKSPVMQVSSDRIYYSCDIRYSGNGISKENLIPVNLHICPDPYPVVICREFAGKTDDHCFILTLRKSGLI